MTFLLFLFSFVLAAAGLFFFSRSKTPLSLRLLFFTLTITTLALYLFYYVSNQFTGEGINDAVIYHVQYGLDGAGFFEYSRLMLTTIAALAVGSVICFKLIFDSKRATSKNGLKWGAFGCMIGAALLNPATIDLIKLQSDTTQSSAEFYRYYQKPQLTSISDTKKNFVIVYAESLERTYFDESVFPGLVPNLRELEAQSTHFTNIQQFSNSGLGFTIAGMTASQLGIPLVAPSHGMSMSGMDEFLPLATGMGELLSAENYSLTYMGGANSTFGGKDKFYKTHGFAEIIGRTKLMPSVADPSYDTAWGLYDDSLLDLTFDKFVQLSEQDAPFGLLTLTLDTHAPEGHPSKSCDDLPYQNGANPILNAVACSDYLIADFVQKIIDSPYAKDTVIVVLSDHLSLPNTADDLLEAQARTNLFMIIDPTNLQAREIAAIGSTLDIAPTFLPFVGYKGEIGLGRDLINDQNIDERLYIHENLPNWSAAISAFWDFPTIEERLTIDAENATFQIDERVFKFPALIQINDKLETTFQFQFDIPRSSHERLAPYAQALSDSERFILIEACEFLNTLNFVVTTGEFCLIAGRGQTYSQFMVLDDVLVIDSAEITTLTDGTFFTPSANRQDALFGSELTLSGYQVALGDSAESLLNVTLDWHVEQQSQKDWTLFLHLINENNELVAQIDQPLGAQFTRWDGVESALVSTWQSGENWQQLYQLPLPTNLPPGTYEVAVGLYEWPSLERLSLPNNESNILKLTKIQLGTE